MTPLQTHCDCLVVGGGPAGLTAALYLARFRRRVFVIDAGNSRAAAISRSHNHPGFKDGIAGKQLIATLRAQAEEHGAIVLAGTVTSLEKSSENFVARTTVGDVIAPRILLATGIADKRPGPQILDSATVSEAIRYCPICDGFEATDKRIGVYGPPGAMPKALFLRTYSRSVTLFGDVSALPKEATDVVTVASSPVAKVAACTGGILVKLEDGQSLCFDVLYPALGCHVHSDLAVSLGAKTNEVGCLVVDDKQKTSVLGLYAAGDVVSDLHQLVVAEGHAAIAATAIHNSLARNLR